MIQCPYDKFTLQLALHRIVSKLEKVPEGEQVETLLDGELGDVKKVQDPASLNQAVAEANGISLETLINSPNYALLKEEYSERVVKKIIGVVMKKLDCSNEEAWALYLSGTGILETL